MSRKIAYIISVLFLLATAFLGWETRNFEIDASAETLLTKDNKKYIFSQIIAKRYNPQEFILIAVKPNDQNIFSTDQLKQIEKISSEIKKIKRVQQVNSLVNAPIFLEADLMGGHLNQDQLSWQGKQYSPEFLKKNLKSHPLYEGLLVNEDQTALGVQVVFKTPKELETIEDKMVSIKAKILDGELSESDEKKLDELAKQKNKIDKRLEKDRKAEISQIKKIFQKYEKNESIFMGGNNLLVYQLISIIKSDLKIFGAAILLITLFLLSLIFRRWIWVITPIVCCFVSIVMTTGLLGLFGLKVTVISANVISLQIILTLAIIIHMIEQFREINRNDNKKSLDDKIDQMVKDKLKPCFYAGLTTSIGFASLIFSGVQPVITFGWMMILAMVVTLAVGLMLFPALIRLFIAEGESSSEIKWILSVMKFFGQLTIKFPKSIIAVSIIATVVGCLGCTLLTAENSFLNYFDKDTDVHRELTYIDQEFGGSTPLDVLYNIPRDEKDKRLTITAETVQHVGKIHRYLQEQKEIGSVTSLYDFTTIARVVREKPMTEYELTFFLKMMDQDLKEKLLGSYFSEKDSQVRISTRVKDSTEGFDREEFVARLNRDLKKLGFKDKEFDFTGLFILYQDILSRLVQSQINTLALVYLIMIIVLWIVFSSFKIALIAMIPNVMTTFITLGIMGFMGIPLDLMTMTIAAVAMGISVDDTIHYTHRYLKEVKNNDADKAVINSHTSVGHALLYTTAIIVIGFGSMIFSDFIPTYYFGLLTGMAMLVALLSDIITLPVILRKFVKE